MKYPILIFLLFFPAIAYAAGLSGNSGISSVGITCVTVATASAASPQTATCAAGFYITGGICTDATVASIAQPTTIGGLGGSITCTAAATNVTATAYCCH